MNTNMLDYIAVKRMKENLEVVLKKMDKAESYDELNSLRDSNKDNFPDWFFIAIDNKHHEVSMKKGNYFSYKQQLQTASSRANLLEIGMKLRCVIKNFPNKQVNALRITYALRQKELS